MSNDTTGDAHEKLLNAVDTAVWAWAVKKATIKGKRCKVTWKNALDELQAAWENYQITMDPREAVLQEKQKDKPT